MIRKEREKTKWKFSVKNSSRQSKIVHLTKDWKCSLFDIYFLKVVKAALPAAGVAKLRDVTKNTFGQFVDEDNRLGRQQICLSLLT